ncbi:RNA-directed DNA polymerase [Arachis hypogaea]|nr:RNA-directed DNA polymerase [Arachis hypogaea]
MAGRENKGESREGVASGVKDVLKQGRVSFRDKVVGASSSTILEALDLLDGDRLASVQGKQGDSSPPSITFTEEAKVTLSQPYKDAIVLKVLDKNLSYTALSYKLSSVWRLKCGYELLNVGHGYFLAKFDTLEERERILLGGPWMVNGRYLAVKPWSPSFRTSECSFGSTMVWVRILGLPIMYYHEKAMNKIASAIGNPIKIDLATKSVDRGKYARACVQIDLGLPVVRRIIVDGIEYNIEYDSLHLVCGLCDCYGHVARECSKRKEDEGNTSPSLAIAIEKQQPQKGALVPENLNCENPEKSQDVFEFGKNPGIINEKPISTDHEEKNHHVKEVNVSSHVDEAGWEVVHRKGKAKIIQGIVQKKGPFLPNTGSKLRETNGPSSSGSKKITLSKSVGLQIKTCNVNETPLQQNNYKRRRPPKL